MSGTAERELKLLKKKVNHMRLAAEDAERRLRFIQKKCEDSIRLYKEKHWKDNITIMTILEEVNTGLRVIERHKDNFRKDTNTLYHEKKITQFEE